MLNLKSRRLKYLISAALLLVFIYQLYWLVEQYKEIESRLEQDINEVLRSADFEELAHRVEEISRMDYKGNVGVRLGYDHKDEKTVVNSDIGQPESVASPGTVTEVSPSTFGSILRTPEDLTRIGLNMQRGIHMSLDGIMEVNLEYLDQLITEKLDSLGVGSVHTLLYIRPGDTDKTAPDTIAKMGKLEVGPNDTFRLELPGKAEYQMIIPKWHLAVIRKMLSSIIFSTITFCLLLACFVYVVRLLRQQKELEAIKTDFTNNITHELKTPIAVAYAANDALLNFDASHNTPRMQRYLKVCQEQLRLLDRLVEQILTLSMERRNSLILNMEMVEINALVSEICENYKMKYAGKVSFTIDMQPELALESDFMHLSNIVGNIIDNAVKYSKGEARVSIKGCQAENGSIILEIKDKGIGMSAEEMSHIFDKFYRVPHGNLHEVKGYGLGLFYVKSMAEKLGGTVSVASSPGKGSCFTLKFPNGRS